MPLTRIFFLERGERLFFIRERSSQLLQQRIIPDNVTFQPINSDRSIVLSVFRGLALRHEERVVVHGLAFVGDVRPSVLFAKLFDDLTSLEGVRRKAAFERVWRDDELPEFFRIGEHLFFVT